MPMMTESRAPFSPLKDQPGDATGAAREVHDALPRTHAGHVDEVGILALEEALV